MAKSKNNIIMWVVIGGIALLLLYKFGYLGSSEMGTGAVTTYLSQANACVNVNTYKTQGYTTFSSQSCAANMQCPKVKMDYLTCSNIPRKGFYIMFTDPKCQIVNTDVKGGCIMSCNPNQQLKISSTGQLYCYPPVQNPVNNTTPPVVNTTTTTITYVNNSNSTW